MLGCRFAVLASIVCLLLSGGLVVLVLIVDFLCVVALLIVGLV